MLRVRATPGHTPEHLAYVLADGAAPVAVFTGGALIAGGVARTDLADPARTEAWTRAAHRSARSLLDGLPEDLPAYPTHGSGSFCSADDPGEHTTTIGREKTASPLLAETGEDALTAALLARLGSYPAYFGWMPALNRRGAPRHGLTRPVLPGLTAGARRRAGRVRGRGGRCPPDRVLRRRPHPRLGVDRAAPGVRDLARLAHRPAAPAGGGARSRAAPRRACRGMPEGRLRQPGRRTRRRHRRLAGRRVRDRGRPAAPARPRRQSGRLACAGCPPARRMGIRAPARRHPPRAGHPGHPGRPRRPVPAAGRAARSHVRARRAGDDRRQPARRPPDRRAVGPARRPRRLGEGHRAVPGSRASVGPGSRPSRAGT